jgi:hypothetical protein
VDSVRLHIRLVFDEIVPDVVAFPRAASGEPGEESDVHIRDHVIADPAVTAVAKVVFGHEILGVEVPLSSVGRGMFTKAPDFRQRKLVVPIDDGRDRFVQLIFGDVPLVDEGHLAPVETTDRSRCLCRTEVESIAEGGHKIALGGIGQFAVMA